jgi:hypothetical protein
VPLLIFEPETSEIQVTAFAHSVVLLLLLQLFWDNATILSVTRHVHYIPGNQEFGVLQGGGCYSCSDLLG